MPLPALAPSLILEVFRQLQASVQSQHALERHRIDSDLAAFRERCVSERFEARLDHDERRHQRQQVVVLRLIDASIAAHALTVNAMLEIYREAVAVLRDQQSGLLAEQKRLDGLIGEVTPFAHVEINKRKSEIDRALRSLSEDVKELHHVAMMTVRLIEPTLSPADARLMIGGA